MHQLTHIVVLNDWLETNGASVSHLARLSGISVKHAAQIVNGHEYASIRTLVRLARATGIDPYLLCHAQTAHRVERELTRLDRESA